MWQQTQCSCLILSVIITGSLLVPWDMTVSPVVFVPRGEDAVLGCSFTHPRQQDYSGSITVKWLARDSRAPPFFSCSLKNNSAEEPKHCSVPGLKQSLKGDPRRGELSLLIRTVHMVDNGTYFCRVELDGVWNNYQRETQLYVTVEPQILSLSVVETNSGSDGATRSLRCEAEGHPLPTVTWLSASGSLLGGDLVRTSQVGTYRLVSSVPYAEEDVLTCRAESRLGGAETMYPDRKTLIITLTVCGLVVLLLLLSTGFIYCRRNRARAELSPAHGNTDSAPADTSPIYGNADVVENHRQQRSDCPAEGDVELHLVYSAVSLTPQYAGFKSSTKHQQETDVLYSPVNVP